MEFQHGKIYTIRSFQTDKFYIGSTNHKTLSQRLSKHKGCYKFWLKDKDNGYMTSFEILKYDDCYIELLELYPCNLKSELHKREGELIRLHKDSLVNNNIPSRTCKEYNVDNKEIIAVQQKTYRNVNIEKIKQYEANYKIANKLKAKEQYAIYKVVNKQKMKEYNKIYNKIYNLENKQKIKNHVTQPYQCDCGSVFQLNKKARHQRTNKHIDVMKQNNKIMISNEDYDFLVYCDSLMLLPTSYTNFIISQ